MELTFTGKRAKQRRIKERSAPCAVCEGVTEEILATSQKPYRYSLSGLKHASLANILVRRCRSCGAESPIIPKIAALHLTIVRSLLEKPFLLSGDEIRFLRKNAGFPAKHFAALVGITPEHLSRVETGKTRNVGLPADKMVRAVISAEASGGEATKQLLLQEAESNLDTNHGQAVIFTVGRTGWKKAAV